MRYGRFLPDGGTIGFAAPSFGCNIEPYKSAFKNALKTFEGMNYRLDCGPNVYEGSGIGISNTPEKCAEEFTAWYTGEENDVLISCGGGELMCEILDHVDFQKIRESEPKWFLGYSDNTNLTFLLATLCDTAAIYGPCAPAFGMEPWHENLYNAMDLLTGKSRSVHSFALWEKESLKTEEEPLMPYNVTEPVRLRYWTDSVKRQGPRQIYMKGRLLGGCLDILTNLCGTCYDQVAAFNKKYEDDGVIWFLEACDLNVLSIRRALWHLSHAGWFDRVNGFLIGRPLCYGEEIMGVDQYKAVTDILSEYHVPIIMDADIGHIPPMMPLVTGSLATVTAKGNCMKIDMEYC